MLLPLLLFGTPWFWMALIVPYLLLIWMVETEASGFALFTVIATAVIFCLGNPTIVPFVLHNPLIDLYAVLSYIAIGVGWGFVKWFFYILKKRDIFASKLTKWKDEVVVWEREDGKSSYRRTKPQEPSKEDFMPTVIDNKGRIVFWMSYWPCSAFWTILSDPLTRFYNFLYHRLASLFDAMSRAMFAKYQG